jgi:hypothetical protein
VRLAAAAAVLQGTLDLCHAAAAPSGNSGASGGGGAYQVQQFVMTCPDGVRTPIAQPRAPFVHYR